MTAYSPYYYIIEPLLLTKKEQVGDINPRALHELLLTTHHKNASLSMVRSHFWTQSYNN
jgi:hypothetical protein